MQKNLLLLVILSVCLCACKPLTTTPKNHTEFRQYKAALEAFFKEGNIQRLLETNHLTQPALYIPKTYSDNNVLISDEVMSELLLQMSKLGLTRIYTEQVGSGVLQMSSIQSLSSVEPTDKRNNPAVFITFMVSGDSCFTLIGIRYLLVRNANGWQAQRSGTAVC